MEKIFESFTEFYERINEKVDLEKLIKQNEDDAYKFFIRYNNDQQKIIDMMNEEPEKFKEALELGKIQSDLWGYKLALASVESNFRNYENKTEGIKNHIKGEETQIKELEIDLSKIENQKKKSKHDLTTIEKKKKDIEYHKSMIEKWKKYL